MFGAEPVPLYEGSSDTQEESDPQQGGDLGPGFGLETQDGADGKQADGPDWQRADGIGMVAGRGGWNGFLIHPLELRSIVHDLRMRNALWIARNDESALIYVRTDASPSTLRALATVYEAGAPPRVVAGTEVSEWKTTGEDLPVLPVPLSLDLDGGHWEFLREWPEAPPPFRAFRVGADALPAGHKGKNRGRSTVITDQRGAKNNASQLHQARAQSKWSLNPRNAWPFG